MEYTVIFTTSYHMDTGRETLFETTLGCSEAIRGDAVKIRNQPKMSKAIEPFAETPKRMPDLPW